MGTKRFGAEEFDSFEIWCWRRMDKVKWSEKLTNEVLEHIREKRTLLNKSKFDENLAFRITIW